MRSATSSAGEGRKFKCWAGGDKEPTTKWWKHSLTSSYGPGALVDYLARCCRTGRNDSKRNAPDARSGPLTRTSSGDSMDRLERLLREHSVELVECVAGGAGMSEEEARVFLGAAGRELLASYR